MKIFELIIITAALITGYDFASASNSTAPRKQQSFVSFIGKVLNPTTITAAASAGAAVSGVAITTKYWHKTADLLRECHATIAQLQVTAGESLDRQTVLKDRIRSLQFDLELEREATDYAKETLRRKVNQDLAAERSLEGKELLIHRKLKMQIEKLTHQNMRLEFDLNQCRKNPKNAKNKIRELMLEVLRLKKALEERDNPPQKKPA